MKPIKAKREIEKILIEYGITTVKLHPVKTRIEWLAISTLSHGACYSVPTQGALAGIYILDKEAFSRICGILEFEEHRVLNNLYNGENNNELD